MTYFDVSILGVDFSGWIVNSLLLALSVPELLELGDDCLSFFLSFFAFSTSMARYLLDRKYFDARAPPVRRLNAC